MPTFLFWNVKQRPIASMIADLAHDRDIRFLILAEASSIIRALLSELNRRDTRYHYHPNPVVNPYIEIISTFPQHCVTSCRDHGRLNFREIEPPIGVPFLLVSAHLGSKMHLKGEDQKQLCTQYASLIEREEERLGNYRTLLVGDMNMNPFEVGMVSGFGFHAVSTRSIAGKERRTIQKNPSRRFFYNPMWRCFGDRPNTPGGTYYYGGSSPIEYYWHVFDQVLVRPSLLPYFDDDSVEIVTKVGTTSLMKEGRGPDQRIGSDHLPLVFDLDYLQGH